MNKINKSISLIKILFIVISFFYIYTSFAGGANSIRDGIMPTGSDNITVVDSSKLNIDGSNSLLNNILSFVRDSIFSLIGIIAIGVFIFIGAKLVVARGNPEELKKATMSFIYAITGIFIVAISWGVVKLITQININ